jgi:hypothetical protein
MVIPPLLESSVKSVSFHDIQSSSTFAPDLLMGSNYTITHLDFSGSPGLLDATILILLDKLAVLESINLAGCMKITDFSSLKIAGKKTIKSIDLSYTNISSVSCYALAGVCRPSVKLNLHYCTALTTDAILHLIKRCSGLVRLGLVGIPDVQRMCFTLTYHIENFLAHYCSSSDGAEDSCVLNKTDIQTIRDMNVGEGCMDTNALLTFTKTIAHSNLFPDRTCPQIPPNF